MSLSAPKVTVVTAAFNSDLLRLAVTSALQQDFDDFEIIVSDDAASGSTQELVASFGDQRCCYRRNAATLGASENHLAAFAVARGEYLAILNHDDIWDRSFLSTLVPILDQNREAVVAFCDHYVIDREGAILEEATEQTSRLWKRSQLAEGLYQPFFKLLGDQSIPIASGAVFRKSAIEPIPPDRQNVGPAYDLWLAYLLCRSQGGAYYKPQRLASWRTHSENVTTTGGIEWALGGAWCWETIASDKTMHEIRHIAREKAALAYYSSAKCCLSEGRKAEGWRYATRSLKLSASWRAVAAGLLCLSPIAVSRLVLGRSRASH